MDKELSRISAEIPGWLTPHEGMFLTKAAKSVRNGDGVVVEIGSYLGKSTVQLAAAGCTVYAVDPHQGNFSGGTSAPTYAGFIKNITKAGVRRLIIPVRKTSAAAARTWDKPVKFLFIDGLHDYEHADEDFTSWNPRVTSGGMIAMHDAFCGWDGAGDVAMRSIVYNPAFGEIGVVGSIIFGKKIQPSFTGFFFRFMTRLVIGLSRAIYRSSVIPGAVKFIAVHRFLRIFLINKYSSLG